MTLHDWLAERDAALSRAARAEAEAAVLREALAEVSQRVAPRLADVVHSATRPRESPKEWLAANFWVDAIVCDPPYGLEFMGDDTLDIMQRAGSALASAPLAAAVARVVECAEALEEVESSELKHPQITAASWARLCDALAALRREREGK